jgi:histidine ammonia-lyase
VKLRRLVANAERVLAIELMTAAEGLEYRRPLRAGRGVEKMYEKVRSQVPRLSEDRSLSADIERMAAVIRSGDFDE